MKQKRAGTGRLEACATEHGYRFVLNDISSPCEMPSSFSAAHSLVEVVIPSGETRKDCRGRSSSIGSPRWQGIVSVIMIISMGFGR